MGGIFLTAQWRNVVMLNYEVPPDILLARVPAGTELDLFRGKALVSVVGFRFEQTRVHGIAIPWHRDFDEINLRFYVRLSADPSRRGVVFVKEIVPRHAISFVARTLYNENYHTHAMRSSVRETAAGTEFLYALHANGREHVLRAKIYGAFEHSLHGLETGSEEEFIAEHYYGYAAQRDGGTLEYRVDHPAWRVAAVREAALDFDVSTIYGDAFAAALAQAPRSALVAEGSAVSVAKPVRVELPKLAPPATPSPA